jgi:hypothetical protein
VRLDADQLEWIVREVVRRLRVEGASAPDSPMASAGDGMHINAKTPHADAHITLTQTLITTSTLEHKLDGVARVNVPPRAVVTPAARDLLKERNIELARNTEMNTG